jgi:hypothetical protein
VLVLNSNLIETRYFKPWIGPKYGQPGINGKAVLILGESIYRCARTSPGRCIELIENNCSGAESHKFYTNIYLACMGPDAPRHRENKRAFWERVSFINFVDDVVEGGSRHAPGGDSIEKAKRDWKNVLAALEPHLIVVLGRRLWGYLPEPDCESCFAVEGLDWHPTVKIYEVDGKTSKATYMRHPSTCFTSRWWNPVIKSFFEQ